MVSDQFEERLTQLYLEEKKELERARLAGYISVVNEEDAKMLAKYFGCKYQPSWHGGHIFLCEVAIAGFDDQQDGTEDGSPAKSPEEFLENESVWSWDGYEIMDGNEELGDHNESENDSNNYPTSQNSLSEFNEAEISDSLSENGTEHTLENAFDDPCDNDSVSIQETLPEGRSAMLAGDSKSSLKRQRDGHDSFGFEEPADGECPEVETAGRPNKRQANSSHHFYHHPNEVEQYDGSIISQGEFLIGKDESIQESNFIEGEVVGDSEFAVDLGPSVEDGNSVEHDEMVELEKSVMTAIDQAETTPKTHTKVPAIETSNGFQTPAVPPEVASNSAPRGTAYDPIILEDDE